MPLRHGLAILGLLGLAVALSATGQQKKAPEKVPGAPLLDILQPELKRNFDVLSKADPPVYFLGYSVRELEFQVLSAANGALTARNASRTRSLERNFGTAP